MNTSRTTLKSLHRLLQLLLFVGLCFSLVSCRVNTNIVPTTPTTPTNPTGKQAPSLNTLKVIFNADESSVINDSARQPILLKTNEKVTLFSTFASNTKLEYAQIFLIPADNSTAIRFDMTCNENSECNYLWDLANPQIDKGLYSLSVRAVNQEGQFNTISDDYESAFLVF